MLKIVIQRLDLPLTFSLLLLLTGCFLLWSRRFRSLSRFCLLTGTCLIFFFSLGIGTSYFLEPLEREFPPLLSPKDLGPVASEIRFVVVLGGEATPIGEWPVTSQMGPTMLTRLTEGIRLVNGLPQARLVLSGGSRFTEPDALYMEKLALELGVAPDRIVLETQSTSTAEEAELLKDLLHGTKFILVTSARHMPRAMALFRQAGLDPIPAPTGHLIVPHEKRQWRHFLPRSGNINLVSHAFYEYLGSFKAWFTRSKE